MQSPMKTHIVQESAELHPTSLQSDWPVRLYQRTSVRAHSLIGGEQESEIDGWERRSKAAVSAS